MSAAPFRSALVRLCALAVLAGCAAREGGVEPRPTAPTELTALRPLDRAAADRPDVTSEPRVKVLYLVPQDGRDRRLDENGTILRSLATGQRWLAAQTGGRTIRFDVADGGLDITFVRLPRAEATYFRYGAFIRDSLQKDLRAAGWTQRDVLLLGYYEGRHVDRCASAAWPPVIPGTLGAVYLHGAPESELPCEDNDFMEEDDDGPGYMEFVVLHELFHLMGVVSQAAPDQGLLGHVITDPTDLMYAGPRPWRPSSVDVTKSNYFSLRALPAGVANFRDSRWVMAP